VGRQVIAPYLRYRGARRIEVLILSHGDGDHVSAVPELARRFSIGRALVPPGFTDTPGGQRAVDALEAAGVDVDAVWAGCRMAGPGDLRVRFLSPPADAVFGKNTNAQSLVAHVAMGDVSVLLTGDVPAAMLAGLDLPAVSVAQVPHHGAAERDGTLFAPSCRYALVGGDAAWVSPAVLSTYRRQGALVYVTGRTGAVEVCAEGNSLRVQTGVRGGE
jgi:competence protein ComEC